MSVILVVERDAGRAERINQALRRDGLSVTTAASRGEALRSAEVRAPSLLLANSTLPEAPALLADFSRRRGGPGAVVMVEGEGGSPADFQADMILAEPFTDDELRGLVRRWLKPEPDAQPDASDSSEAEQLTSADIFGDMLAEVEAEARSTRPATAARKPSLPMEDIERRLEETLSGVIAIGGKGKRSGAARAPEQRDKTSKRRPELPTDTEIDDLLDQTLSSLDISTRSRKPPAAAPPQTERHRDQRHRDQRHRDQRHRDQPKEQPGEVPPAPLRKDAEATAATPPVADLAVTPEPAAGPSFGGSETPEAPDRWPSSAAPAEEVPADSIPAEKTGAEGFGAGAPIPLTALDDLQPEANQFRTQALPTLDLAAELAAEASDGETFGDYTLLDRIAIGGMAEVWRARRRGVEGFQKIVAIKKILSHLTGSQDFITMFIDEAKLAAQLSHNNIIQIYDLGKVGDDFFIAMEHVDGKDLRSILTAAQKSSRPIPLGLGLLIVSAVAQALDYAHRKRDFDGDAMGLVHRDVSPQNVMISFEGAIKLCDFGIVKAVAKASTTQMGALKGKLQYMSPEQAWGKSVDARSDIFSLGSVFYEVLTGSQLFSGDSEIGVLDAVRECRISSPRKIVPEISEEVARIALKALAKSPDERFQTAGDLELEIRAVLDNLRPTPSQKALAAYLHTLFETPKSGAVALAEPGAAASDQPAAPAGTATPASPSFLPPVAAPVAGTPAAETPESPTTGPPVAKDSAAAGAVAPRTGRWKWLVAAVVAIVLIGLGLLALPKLWQRDASTPDASPPQVEAAPPPVVIPAPLEDATAAAAGDPTGAAAGDPTGAAAGDPTGAAAGDPTAAAAGDPTAAAAGDPTAAAAGTEVVETTADVTGEEPAEPGPAVTAAGIDIEQMVNEELTNRAEQLEQMRRDFEAKKKRMEEELARTREESRRAEEEDGKDDGSGDGES